MKRLFIWANHVHRISILYFHFKIRIYNNYHQIKINLFIS
jgi:hypothetical protein